jgi:iron transport multicopper oxidase
MGAMAAQYVQFDQHTMTIVEVDGLWTQPYDTTQLFVGVAQRYSVIVKAKPDKTQNFAIVASMNSAMFAEGATPAGAVTTVSIIKTLAASDLSKGPC